MTHTIEEKLNENIDLILSGLKIDFTETGNRYFFPCPIHGSDNYSSLTIYKNGKWRCFTRGCHEHSQYGVIGFVMALLKCDKHTAIEKCLSFLNLTRTCIPKKYKSYPPTKVDREKILPYVTGNIEFYLRRGYSREILKKYDVFICAKKYHQLYGRAVFPIYENTNDFAVGFVGRTLQPKCAVCEKYHPKTIQCPIQPYDKMKCEKWLNSKGFARNKYFYNQWFAKDYIKKSGCVILVEGQGDVLKLEMAGIHNSLGIFGVELTQAQNIVIDKLAPRRVYISTDNDTAGSLAAQKLLNQLKSRFEVVIMTPTQKDFGDMDIQEIQEYFTLNYEE